MRARWRQRVRRLHADQSGSAVVEFVLVSALLTVLTLSVIQLALALHIRNTVLDAAAEGARYASLADTSLGDGVTRTRDLISTALSPGYASDVSAATTTHLGQPAVIITVNTPLPLIGLVGIENGLEVSAHAAIEQVR
ncbi:TadE-like protein [Salinibacterium amurskyense]|uniref:TadE-like protein n=1 Tax=Salinibacterium amurskyense TaxID=205941 RepID=A0A2M9D3S2_9MICO|nr:TadE family protein [Salinibacterium amurskyense]PJJ78846.1 TadE-like protein [Salinibacterium amurskyense]RLQ80905.1 pilus assembly protein [Salinibacterium amurskyense]